MPGKHKGGVARSIKVTSGGRFGGSQQSATCPVAQSSKHRQIAYDEQLQKILGMSFEDREHLQQLENDMPDVHVDDDPELLPLPPGERGYVFQ
ncbi:uncharacterized protein TRAVEDRAFT_53203 [Trametes versicolor FP-101664 SS1]|uniref:uncharacterized protein n=1 Tax=Trametes versicolor (strain FP-101664) TaxID=717944 RepID=UPI0004622DB1|nr:uncharacterized protein TRAVEDRAFT_53203 [Trametes versicolor FP-101664 SS1]EIW52764.1 hypothetical protein TRAVEDRAFT_53203 [Trametes versicolor FP-101664 SS1]